MTIGTAKPREDETEGIPHHLIDFVSPDKRYSVADYKKDAEEAIKDIIDRNKFPIIVGGTGLYVDSLIYGIDFPNVEYDEEYRNKLMEYAETENGLKELYEKAKKIDPEAVSKISNNDKKRIIRILEIYNSTGLTKTELEIKSRENGPAYDYRVFAINMDRDKLYERINLRVDLMIKEGLVEEVQNLIEKYSAFPTAMQGLRI